MGKEVRKSYYRRRINRMTLLAILVWTAIIWGSADWNIRREHEKVLDLARVEAKANLNKDRAFRLWTSSKGGIYLPVDENTQASPYLAHIPDRDVNMKGNLPT